MGHAQALVQTAVASQMALTQGVQQAVRDWQQQVAATLGDAKGAADTAVPWSDLLARWTSAVQSVATPAMQPRRPCRTPRPRMPPSRSSEPLPRR